MQDHVTVGIQSPGLATAQEARAFILASRPKVQELATPWWPELDGKLALRDIPAAHLLQVQNLDDQQAAAFLITESVCWRQTGDPVFQPTDREAVLQLGISILMPLVQAISAFLGIQAPNETIAQAKKNSKVTMSTGFGIFSVPSASTVP
jgi:hypothetical protein